MYSFSELKKTAKLAGSGKEFKLVILGNVATQFFSQAIQGYGKKEGINLSVLDTDYNQINAQLLDPHSETFRFEPDGILLYIATNKLYEEFMDTILERLDSFAERYMATIEKYWNLIKKYGAACIFQTNFTEIDDAVMGNYSAKTETSFIYQMRKLNYLLQEKMKQRKDVYVIDLLAVQIELGQHQFYDPALYYNAKMAIHIDALPHVAKRVVAVVKSMQGKVKKCIILDLDNTLWGGVIGDDGMGGIEIGELGRGHAFTDLQRWLKQLKDRGILLAVCSKNNENTAKTPFINHEEMVLRLDDISIFVANWNDKVSNIRFIQKNLNIGMDSLVFLDDNIFERNLVRAMLPEVTVPELPDDPACYLLFLQEANLFETASYSSEDRDRTSQYQAEFKRKKYEIKYESLDNYLRDLEMIGQARPFEPLRYSRIAQLTQRSNQFNLRTIRYNEDEIEKMAQDDQYVTLFFTLKDKFGDHGLVSVVIMKKMSDANLFIDTWVMSCRVLKRGMEEFIVNKLVETARQSGAVTIDAEYIPTPKNFMVKDIYKTMGFVPVGDSQYTLNVFQYTQKHTFIMEA